MHASISMPDNPELAGGAQRVHLNYLAPPVLHLQFALGHCSPWKWRKKKKKSTPEPYHIFFDWEGGRGGRN